MQEVPRAFQWAKISLLGSMLSEDENFFIIALSRVQRVHLYSIGLVAMLAVCLDS